MINYSHLPVKGFAQEVGARVNGKKQRLWRCCYYCARRSEDALTEEEKKRKALEMFAQEQARLLNRSPLQRINNDHTTRIQASLARSDRQRRMDCVSGTVMTEQQEQFCRARDRLVRTVT